MTAVAGSLSVEVVEEGLEEPMLVVGCREPRDYPLHPSTLDRLKRVVARCHGVAEEHVDELDFEHPSFTATRIPLLGLAHSRFAHLSHRTDCDLITSTKQALGIIGAPDAPVGVGVAHAGHSHGPSLMKRQMPLRHH